MRRLRVGGCAPRVDAALCISTLRISALCGFVLCLSSACATEPKHVLSDGTPYGSMPVLDAAIADGARRDANVVGDASTAQDGGPDAIGRDAAMHDAASDSLLVPEARAPSWLGMLVGPGSQRPPENLRLYGTDLGITFEHEGQLQILFGDTWPDAEHICGAAPLNDDTLASLPLTFSGEVPELSFVTDPDAPMDAERAALPLQVMRGDQSLAMGFGQVPMAAFSDGVEAFAFVARLVPMHCDAPSGEAQCPVDEGLACSDEIGECQPAFTTMTLSCDLGTQLGCLPGQQCVEVAPICIDPTSAQHDGSIFGSTASIAQQIELTVQGERANELRSIFTWPTSKFATLTARTVERFSGARVGNDYTPGHGELLVWGRPGFIAEHGRESQLYLMTHSLPLTLDGSGDQRTARFTPRYFAGLDPITREPMWTAEQGEAKPLALDGVENGDPHEAQTFSGQMAVSWLGAPIDKWVMLYGGDLTDFLMIDPPNGRSRRAPGAVMMRFADHPWGPWSPPTPHLLPGTPTQQGDLYGPGGLLYHPQCVDTDEALCARSDLRRPPDSAAACLISTQAIDPGRLYGVNIIDNYTAPNEQGGLDFIWNVSLWNPYAVAMMKTRVVPAAPAVRDNELSDARGLARMSDFRSLPTLEPGRRYRQQTSRDRGTDDASFPLSGFGNRDFNNFHCKSADAELGANQFAPFQFDRPACEEDYVKGAVLGRFEGRGRLVRTWIGMASLLLGPADNEMLRIYVDDDPVPRVEARLAAVLDGSAGEIFAPPFGAGSQLRMAWYYPVAFERKLIVALDRLGDFDEYFYHCDVAYDAATDTSSASTGSLELATRNDRQRALVQLGATYHPAGAASVSTALLPRRAFALAAGQSAEVAVEGPATIHELSLRVAELDLPSLADTHVSVYWDDTALAAIDDVPLLDLFASGRAPPQGSTPALTSFVEGGQRVLMLKLPMPFATNARFVLSNRGATLARFELALRGERALPAAPFGELHVLLSDLDLPTEMPEHVSVELPGQGRLAGVCAYLEGRPDPAGGLQYGPLNLLEGDVRVWTDGELALDGTGTEEYADDVFYFTDAPHTSPFVQAWGLVNDLTQSLTGEASLCRWHLLGTELDFQDSLQVRFELGGAGNPEIVARHRTVAYVYLSPP